MKIKGTKLLERVRLLITAGPTQEPIDPVRYLSNYSSGKMGYAMVQAAVDQGAKVTLISGPVQLSPPPSIEVIRVTTAQEMIEQVMRRALFSDIFISVAAVVDYRVESISLQKIKRTDHDKLTLHFVKNPDIVKTVAALKKNRPYVVGFAAESENLIDYARKKLREKQLDMIIANDISHPQSGFGGEMNAVSIFYEDQQIDLSLAPKSEIAKELIQCIAIQWSRYAKDSIKNS